MRKRCDDENCEDCGISETPWVMYFLEAEFRFFLVYRGVGLGLEDWIGGGNRQAFKDIFFLKYYHCIKRYTLSTLHEYRPSVGLVF